MNYKPLVSVIMSVYNETSEYLVLSVESIIKQTCRNLEFLIVDDGSDTEIQKKIDKIVSNDERIRLFRQKNKGLTKTLNWLIRHSKGTYIARQDSDDISTLERIEKQVSYLNENQSLKLVGTGCLIIDDKGKVLRRERVKTNTNVLKRRLRHTNQFIHGSVMFHSDIFKNGQNMYSEDCNYAQDYDLFLRISEKYNVANIDEPLYKYRISNDSISQTKIREQLYMGMIIREAAKMRRKNINLTWNKELYKQIDASLKTKAHQRKLEFLVLTAQGRNALLTNKKKEAQKVFLRAFFTCPGFKSIYRIIATWV